MQLHIAKYDRERGHEVLFTPPHHSWWQPIELNWASVKNPVASKVPASRSMKETLDELNAAIAACGTAEHRSEHIKHCVEKIV